MCLCPSASNLVNKQNESGEAVFCTIASTSLQVSRKESKYDALVADINSVEVIGNVEFITFCSDVMTSASKSTGCSNFPPTYTSGDSLSPASTVQPRMTALLRFAKVAVVSNAADSHFDSSFDFALHHFANNWAQV